MGSVENAMCEGEYGGCVGELLFLGALLGGVVVKEWGTFYESKTQLIVLRDIFNKPL